MSNKISEEQLYCYLIKTVEGSKNNKTYIGATNDFNRRLKQHNGLIKGGAKSTRGYKWEASIIVCGFETRNDLLSFEWHWKHIKLPATTKFNRRGIYYRIDCLERLLDTSIPENNRWANLKVLTNFEIGSLLDIKQPVDELNFF